MWPVKNVSDREGRPMVTLNLPDYKKLTIEEVARQFVVVKELNVAGDVINEKTVSAEEFKRRIFSD